MQISGPLLKILQWSYKPREKTNATEIETHTRKSNYAGKNKSNHLLWKLDKWTWNQTIRGKNILFLNCLVGFLIPIVFFNLNCSNVLDLRNLQEQVKKKLSVSKSVLLSDLWLFFSHSRSEQFWKENTNGLFIHADM